MKNPAPQETPPFPTGIAGPASRALWVVRAAVPALVFLSGAVALVYEMLWHRQFSLLFGASAPATAAVLAAYFAGLGLGSWAWSHWASRWRSPLRVYAVLEVSVGYGALLVGPVLEIYSRSYPVVTAAFAGSPSALLALKGVLGFIAIAVPTVAMGATLPVLARVVPGAEENPGARVGWLYLANTAGAALGTILVPLFLLPQFGLRNATVLSAAINFSLAAAALWLASSQPGVPEREPPSLSLRAGRRVLALAFYSGAGLFALQVLWNRAFAQVHSNSLQSFAMITALFILFVAAGTQLARVLLRGSAPEPVLARTWLWGGIATLAAPLVFVLATDRLSEGSSSNGRLAGIALVTVALPVTLLSTSIPLLFQSLARTIRSSASRVTGVILAVNTLGCICGALIGGFLLPSLLGVWKGIGVVGVAFVALALNLQGIRRSMAIRLAPLLLLFLVLQSDLPRAALSAEERLLALEEGAYGISAVVQRPDGSRRLKLNNHYILGGTLSTGDQRMQAHIPLLLGGTNATVAFLGYGTGITAGGALFHPGIQATSVELVPEVAQLAATYFGEANLGFAAHPNTQLVLDDARNFLRGSGRTFGCVVGDLVVPWRHGEGSLYTLEHFEAMKAALVPGGVACVWVPMFQVDEAEFRMVLATFLRVFPEAYLWRGDFSPHQPAYGLVAFQGGEHLDAEKAEAALVRMRPDPANPHLSASTLFWMHLIGSIDARDLAAHKTHVHTEDRPRLELGGGGDRAQSAHFIGRPLQAWENRVRDRSRAWIEQMPGHVKGGWEAGRAMVEFTNLAREGQSRAAVAVQQQIRAQLGPGLAPLLFGN